MTFTDLFGGGGGGAGSLALGQASIVGGHDSRGGTFRYDTITTSPALVLGYRTYNQGSPNTFHGGSLEMYNGNPQSGGVKLYTTSFYYAGASGAVETEKVLYTAFGLYAPNGLYTKVGGLGWGEFTTWYAIV